MSEENIKADVKPEFNFISKKSERKGLQITMYGMPGVGKSTLASTFNNKRKTLAMIIEPSARIIYDAKDIDCTLPITKSSQVHSVLQQLIDTENDYGCVILDSISKMDEIISEEVLGEDPKKSKSLNQAHGGYGAGIEIVKNRHIEIKKLCDKLVTEKNMIVIFVAHSSEYTQTNSATAQEFLYSDISLNKKYSDKYTYYVDVVAKIYPAFYVTEGRMKTTDSGKRMFDCVTNAAQCSKNNLGISQAIEFSVGENPLEDYI